MQLVRCGDRYKKRAHGTGNTNISWIDEQMLYLTCSNRNVHQYYVYIFICTNEIGKHNSTSLAAIEMYFKTRSIIFTRLAKFLKLNKILY